MDARRLLPLAALALGLGLASAGGVAEDAAEEPAPASKVRWTAQGTVLRMNTLGGQEFDLRLVLDNPTDREIRWLGGHLLLGLEGGWLVPLEPAEKGSPLSFLRETHAVPAGGEVTLVQPVDAKRPTWRDTARHVPASYAVVAGAADDGPTQVVFPLGRESFETPPVRPFVRPFGTGVAGPLEVIPFSDGQRSLLLVGQHQCLGTRPAKVKTHVLVADAAGALQPLVWEGLGERADLPDLWPFVRRIDVPASFANGTLKLIATAEVDGKPVLYEGEWPVRTARPVELYGPVLASNWQLGNGPGQIDLHSHYVQPEQRYAYDFVVMEQGRTWRGDPEKNESYFAWDRSVRAAEDGTIVDVCDHEPDVSGAKAAMAPCHRNRVVLRHGEDLYTVYLNIKKDSATQRQIAIQGKVRRGQVIGRVGNSGGGPEPHLQFMAYRIGATGRAETVPVVFRNAYHDTAGTRRVEGVPVGGRIYHFIDRLAGEGNGGR